MFRNPTNQELWTVESWLSLQKARQAIVAARVAMNECENATYNCGFPLTSETVAKLNNENLLHVLGAIDELLADNPLASVSFYPEGLPPGSTEAELAREREVKLQHAEAHAHEFRAVNSKLAEVSDEGPL